MLELRKTTSYLALIVLAACTSGAGSPGSMPPSSANEPALRQRVLRESPLAGSGPAITITSYAPQPEVALVRDGLTFAYGGIYYSFLSRSGPRSWNGVAFFNGREWGDYQSYAAPMFSPLALDSNGNVYSIVENSADTDIGIVRYDPHTGVESREFLPMQLGLTGLAANIAIDSRNQLWLLGTGSENAEIFGAVSNPATPEQTFHQSFETFASSDQGYMQVTSITKGGDGNMWGTGHLCSGFNTCPYNVFRWSSSSPSTQTIYNVPNQPGAAALGPDGNVWFVMPGASEIGRITTNGTIAVYNVPAPSGASTFSPSAIAAGKDGALWFLSGTHPLVGRITTNGSVAEYQGAPGQYVAITGGISPSAPAWFSTPGSLDRVTVP